MLEPCKEITPVCETMFRNIEKQLVELVACDRERNGRYDRHLDEGIKYRIAVDRHEVLIKDMMGIQRELRVWALSLLVVLLTASLYLGGRFWSLQRLEVLHPYGTPPTKTTLSTNPNDQYVAHSDR